MVGAALLGAGTIIKAYGDIQSANAQAKAEEQNASFYREQAGYAEISGQRQLEVFDAETQVLVGQQGSAFAKAGVDMSSAANFIGNQALMRQREAYSIKAESDMNVRLANLRADHSQASADAMRQSGQWAAVGDIIGGGSRLFG
jgi:hypothetical protein